MTRRVSWQSDREGEGARGNKARGAGVVVKARSAQVYQTSTTHGSNDGKYCVLISGVSAVEIVYQCCCTAGVSKPALQVLTGT